LIRTLETVKFRFSSAYASRDLSSLLFDALHQHLCWAIYGRPIFALWFLSLFLSIFLFSQPS